MTLLPLTVSCGGPVATTPLPRSAVAQQAVDPCLNFTSTPAAAGTMIAIAAADAASYPNAVSCADVTSLHNGAILVGTGVPESVMDTVVGLDPANSDTASSGAGTVDSSPPAAAAQPINATAVTVDADGALTELVVSGDPSQTQGEIAEWAGEQATAAAHRRAAAANTGFASAWTTMMTQELRLDLATGGSGLSRATTIYRLNGADQLWEYFLVVNRVTTTPATHVACVAVKYCDIAIVERQTGIGADGAGLLDQGPLSTNTGSASIQIGDALQSGDGASGTYSISWQQPSVTTRDVSAVGGTWQELFTSDPAVPPSFTSTNRFTSYNAAIFKFPGTLQDRNFSVSSAAAWAFVGNSTAQTVDRLVHSFRIRPPELFEVNGSQSTFPTIIATNGNGGALRWKVVSPSSDVALYPSSGSYETQVRYVKTGGPPLSFPFTAVIGIGTVPSFAAGPLGEIPLIFQWNRPN